MAPQLSGDFQKRLKYLNTKIAQDKQILY